MCGMKNVWRCFHMSWALVCEESSVEPADAEKRCFDEIPTQSRLLYALRYRRKLFIPHLLQPSAKSRNNRRLCYITLIIGMKSKSHMMRVNNPCHAFLLYFRSCVFIASSRGMRFFLVFQDPNWLTTWRKECSQNYLKTSYDLHSVIKLASRRCKKKTSWKPMEPWIHFV